MNRAFRLLGLLSLLAGTLQAQPYPKRYFNPPIDGPLLLSATFGEIRTDHFHSGIDITTGGMTGIPVKAAAEGYISRIKVTPDGFGNVLYVTHPNGFVSVYAHLERFRDDLQTFTRSAQLERRSFAVELLPKKNEFTINQGDTIAWSGNSGSSQAPHLHFEIRDQRTEEPINPLLFGLQAEDHIKPELRALRVYPLMENGIVEGADSARSYEIFLADTVYGVGTSEYIKVFGLVSVGFEVIDHMEGIESELGIYTAELYIDNLLAYTWTNDRFDFDDTRYVNAHIDYLVKQRQGNTIQRCQRLMGNQMSLLYPDTGLTGLLEFTGDDSHDLKFIARDFAGNEAVINFQLQSFSAYADAPYLPHPKEAARISPSRGIAVHKENLDVIVPAGAVYQECYYQDDFVSSADYLSPIYYIGDPYEALHVPITVSIKPDKDFSDTLAQRLVLVRIDFDGSAKAQAGSWNKDMLSAKVKRFGAYAITMDTLPPVVVKEYYPADLNTSKGGVVQVRVSDALSGIRSVDATIDDQWVLPELDGKSGTVTLDLKGFPLNMLHTVKLSVTDERGNTNNWADTFWW